MKKLFLSAIVGLSLASATQLNFEAGMGMGYIDNGYKNVIIKFNNNLNSYFYSGGKVAKDYFKGYIATIPVFVNKKILLNGKLGFEKYKIENKNEMQEFIGYRALLTSFEKLKLEPKAAIQIGTKGISTKIGTFLIFKQNLDFEYEIGRRWLYKKVENKKNTMSTAIYINYFF